MKRPVMMAGMVVALDALGIGCVMPVLPGLLRELGVGDASLAWHYGVLLASYAALQTVCAPWLGRLADRVGRRPVLLVSLACAALDYAVAARASGLATIYAARAVAGITGATGAVAGACVADAAPPAERARAFGLLGACYGAGMIAGPALGGLLGGQALRAPFAAAALLNAVACVAAWRWLPETGRAVAVASMPGEGAAVMHDTTPRSNGLTRWLGVYAVMQAVGQIPATLWAIFCAARFGWSPGAVGLSLAGFGALHALVQAGVAGPLTARWGERRTLAAGIAIDALGYVLVAFASSGAWLIPGMLCLALGGVGAPALQGLLSGLAGPERQGALQGRLASLNGLTAMGGPLVVGALRAATGAWDGWVWLAGALLYLLCAPLWPGGRHGVSD
jgi:MFS transporter, DHA1 family, tetracycline resistance protein